MFKSKISLTADTKLTLTQFVPQNKWFLVPNPSVKLAHKGLAGEHSLLEASWDTLSRSGGAGLTLYGGEEKAYKAAVELHSLKGAKATARAKLRKGLVHSVAATVSSASGGAPVLTLKSRVSDETKMETTYDVSRKVVLLHAKHKAAKQADNGPTPQILLNVAAPVGRGAAAPLVTVGMKWHF